MLHRRGHTNTKHRISGLPYPHHCRQVCTRRPRRSLNHWQDANYLSNATHICLLLTQRAVVRDRGLAPYVQPTSERTSASPHLTPPAPLCLILWMSGGTIGVIPSAQPRNCRQLPPFLPLLREPEGGLQTDVAETRGWKQTRLMSFY